MRLRVGLTGGIGSGKSEVAKIFSLLGALVVDADALAREAVARGTAGAAAVAARWPQVLLPDGSLDRPALAAIVFRDGRARDELGAIVHPIVRELGAAREAGAGEDQIVVHDVPLLFEGGFYRLCDANVLVVADPERRIARLLARSAMSPDEARRRMAAQIDPERARELADYTLENDSSMDELHEAVRVVYEDLRTRIRTASRASAAS